MFLIVAIVLLVFWGVGLFTKILGGFVHIFLLIALLAFAIHLMHRTM